MKDINATILIDLDNRSEEEVFRSVKYTRRKYVKQAWKAGLHSEKTSGEESLRKIYEEHMKTLKDGGAAPWTFEKWRDFIKSSEDKLFFIKKDKKIVGCFALGEINEKFLGANSERKGIRPFVYAGAKEYNHLRTNDFMYWETIKYALDNGYSFVDLGGWQINARGHLKHVNKFKEEWGGKIVYYYLDYPVLTAIRRKLIRNSGLLWSLNSYVKKKVGKIGKSVHDDIVKDAAARNRTESSST